MKYFIVSYRAASSIGETSTGSITLSSDAAFFNKKFFNSYMEETFGFRDVVIIFIMRLTKEEYEAYAAD